MANRRISMFEYRHIITQMRLGESDRALARSGVISRTTAKQIRSIASREGWLSTEAALPDDTILAKHFKHAAKKSSTTSLAQPFEEEIKQWAEAGIQGSTIHATLVRKYHFEGSYHSVQRFVKKHQLSTIKGSTVLSFSPGECAQLDFGKGPDITDVGTGETFKTWIFVMVQCWSRHMYAEIVKDQKVETWLRCHRQAFEFFNGVPARLTIDNAKCAITKACYHDSEVQRAYAECAEGYGFIISPCAPRDPKKKGRVESGVKYVKNNFVPLREFRSLADANTQLKTWVLETAGNRKHGSTHEKPLNRFNETEKYLLKKLPESMPELSVWKKVKVHGDCHVQFEKCRYSVSYKHIKQSLWLRATESTVRIYKDYEVIALHPRLFSPGKRHTIDEHLPPDGLAYKMQDPQWCQKQAKQIGLSCYKVIQHLFKDKVLDNLRAAQGIISLQKKYTASRLEAACHRALAFGTINYRSVKTILSSGVEYDTLLHEEAFDQLAESYCQGGKYYRDTKTILQ